MTYPETYNALGHYCGRFGPGFWGEPANSLSNIAFLIGGLLALYVWRQDLRRPPFVVALIVLAIAVGLGSFIFHSSPGPTTLMGDLIPIQVFSLSAVAYILRCRLQHAWIFTGTSVLAFFLARQLWILIVPPGLMGGAVSHVPALIMLALLAWRLRRARDDLWRYLAMAIAAYVAALGARSLDVPLCREFPVGFHWLWHLLTGLTASLIIYGAARHPQPH